MVKRCAAVAVVAIAIGLICATAFAMCGSCGVGETKSKSAASTVAPVKVNNTVCPVTGNKVDMKNPVTVEYNGKIYNLCCPMCPDTFKSNPEKYSRIAEDQAKGK